jgi:hypothetical protein
MAGQPTKYKTEYNEQVYELALLGATDKEFARFFNVTETTVNNWKIAEPEFFESIKRGKETADMQVTKSLFKRANGYTYDEIKVKESLDDYETTTTTKHVVPDVAAINIWLKNRRGRIDPEKGQKWADRHEVDHTTGGEKLKTTIIVVDQITQDNLNELMDGD